MPRQTKLTVVPDSPMSGVEPDGFYQTPNSMAIKAIRAKLTAADWILWAYLQMIDPYGDRMVDLPNVSEIALAIGVSERQVKRSLSRLESEELYLWEPVIIRGQNLAGKQVKELCQKKRDSKFFEKRKMTTLSSDGQSCPTDDNFVQAKTTLSSDGQLRPKRSPKPLSDNNSNASQTIQTYSDFIQTLSESERANFLNFCEEAALNLSQPVNDIEAWLAHKTKAGLNRWEGYYQKFKAKQKTQTNKSKSSSSSQMMKKFQLEIDQQRQRAEKAWLESPSATETGGTT